MSARNPHASTEQLADLLAGVLADAEAGSVAAHASECAQCGAVRDRLAALPDVLASVPAPALPAEVAGRLDAALAAESGRRAAAASQDTVVVPLRKVRRDRVRHLFAGAATAVAALVAISVAADVIDLGSGSGSDAVSDQSAGTGDQEGALTGRDPGVAPEDTAPEDAAPEDNAPDAASGAQKGADDFARVRLPEVAADDFAADVELLYDSGAFRAQQRLSEFQDSGAQAPTDATDGFMALTRDDACGNRALRESGLADGTAGPFVLLEQKVVRLVADGPAAARLVQAYSCDDGSVVDRAVIDLSR